MKLATDQYDDLIARFCADSVKRQGISYGDDPMHDPEKESIESVSLSGQTAIVRTRRIGRCNFVADNEYHPAQQSGEWRIASLLYVDKDEKYECL
jgi:hypothetical protein